MVLTSFDLKHQVTPVQIAREAQPNEVDLWVCGTITFSWHCVLDPS